MTEFENPSTVASTETTQKYSGSLGVFGRAGHGYDHVGCKFPTHYPERNRIDNLKNTSQRQKRMGG